MGSDVVELNRLGLTLSIDTMIIFAVTRRAARPRVPSYWRRPSPRPVVRADVRMIIRCVSGAPIYTLKN